MNLIKLSPSSVGLFKECPKCFWLYIKKRLHRPRGPFPSLPGGMDEVIKKYFDQYRKMGKLPPELEGKVSGKLAGDLAWIEKWRDWQKVPPYLNKSLGVKVRGGLDDCLQDGNVLIPLDFKTRGYPPKGNSEKYYQHQLDIYALLLAENREEPHPVANFGYLLYYYPQKVKEKGRIDFATELVKLETSLQRAKDLIKNAVAVLKGPEPESHSQCEYCLWHRLISEFD